MSGRKEEDLDVQGKLSAVPLPSGITVRRWKEVDSDVIRRLSKEEGWPTPETRPEDTLAAWQNSWPTLVAMDDNRLVGFLRALSDGQVTTYVCEFLVDPEYRGNGIGRELMEACHCLVPKTRIDLLSTVEADGFYEAYGCRSFQGYRKNY